MPHFYFWYNYSFRNYQLTLQTTDLAHYTIFYIDRKEYKMAKIYMTSTILVLCASLVLGQAVFQTSKEDTLMTVAEETNPIPDNPPIGTATVYGKMMVKTPVGEVTGGDVLMVVEEYNEISIAQLQCARTFIDGYIELGAVPGLVEAPGPDMIYFDGDDFYDGVPTTLIGPGSGTYEWKSLTEGGAGAEDTYMVKVNALDPPDYLAGQMGDEFRDLDGEIKVNIDGYTLSYASVSAAAASPKEAGGSAKTENAAQPVAIQANNGMALWNANKLQGCELSTTAPSIGNVLTYEWDSQAGRGMWAAAPAPGGVDNDWLINRNDMSSIPSGNVGIGTTNPSNKLTVVGGIDISNYIRHGNDTDTRIGFSANDEIRFRTNSIDQMTISSLGRIGIGKTNPASKLDVSGTVRAGHYRDSNGGHLLRSSDNSITITEDTDGSWNLVTTGVGGDNDWAAPGGGDPTLGGEVYHTGNVGIGVTNPAARLHTNGSLRFAGLGQNNNFTRILAVDASDNVAYRTTGGIGDNLGNHTVEQNLYMGNHWINYGSTNSEGIRLDPGGDVFIGSGPLESAGLLTLGGMWTRHDDDPGPGYLHVWHGLVANSDDYYMVSPGGIGVPESGVSITGGVTPYEDDFAGIDIRRKGVHGSLQRWGIDGFIYTAGALGYQKLNSDPKLVGAHGIIHAVNSSWSAYLAGPAVKRIAGHFWNNNNQENDFSVFAGGAAKSFFAADIGVGTMDPQATLHLVRGTNPEVLRLEGIQPVATADNYVMVVDQNRNVRYRTSSLQCVDVDYGNGVTPQQACEAEGAGYTCVSAKWVNNAHGCSQPAPDPWVNGVVARCCRF